MHRIVTTLILLTISVCTAAANRRSSLPRKLNEEGMGVLHNDNHVKEAADDVIAQLFHKYDQHNKPDKEHHYKHDHHNVPDKEHHYKHDHHNVPDQEHHHKEDSYYYEKPLETYKADHHGATPYPTSSPTKSLSKAPHNTGYNPKPGESGYYGATPYPTSSPTKSPTGAPSKSPTNFPTKWPTGSPAKWPTSSPTEWPTSSPTPTYSPTKPQSCKKHGEKCKCGVDLCCPGLKTTCDQTDFVEWGLCLEQWEE